MVVEPRERVLRLAAVHGRLVHLLDMLLALCDTNCSISFKAALDNCADRLARLQLQYLMCVRAENKKQRMQTSATGLKMISSSR